MIELNKIYCGDARELLRQIPDESVDLVFTDPPYPKAFSNCFDILAEECPRIMKHGASLVTLLGHYQLESVIHKFHGKLKYRWILDMEQSAGQHSRMAMGVEVMWKPALWYVKGSYPSGRGFLRDAVSVNRTKETHVWEQDMAWSDYYIPRLCPEYGIVVDPFCGSGAFLLSAINYHRNFYGFDIDAEAVKTADRRIKTEYYENYSIV